MIILNCPFCKHELRDNVTCYHCDNCWYNPRFWTFSELSGTFSFDFQIDVDSKRYVVVCFKIPGKNVHLVTEPGTGLFRHSKMITYKRGKIISGPQDAFDFCQKILSLKAFL